MSRMWRGPMSYFALGQALQWFKFWFWIGKPARCQRLAFSSTYKISSTTAAAATSPIPINIPVVFQLNAEAVVFYLCLPVADINWNVV